jgi:hypothetical protein
VDLIFVEDDFNLFQILKGHTLKNFVVEYYEAPDYYFFETISEFHKNTKIVLDDRFDGHSKTGLEAAKELHAMGFENLYLYSGKRFLQNELPSYLTFILKDDLKKLRRLLKK